MGKGFFGGLFDFNSDGQISGMEQVMEFALLDELLREEEAVDADYEPWEDDDEYK